ncbi:MAG: hypothetical protein K0R75_2395 [Paenibacillaceae bacterium]|jgi:hypothetical protein|nr:hypothetical protein [Paenibacillaceae bacterium]
MDNGEITVSWQDGSIDLHDRADVRLPNGNSVALPETLQVTKHGSGGDFYRTPAKVHT